VDVDLTITLRVPAKDRHNQATRNMFATYAEKVAQMLRVGHDGALLKDSEHLVIGRYDLRDYESE